MPKISFSVLHRGDSKELMELSRAAGSPGHVEDRCEVCTCFPFLLSMGKQRVAQDFCTLYGTTTANLRKVFGASSCSSSSPEVWTLN